MFNFNLGDEVRDVVTGLTGIVVGRADYLAGCRTMLVSPRKLTREGKRVDSDWIDEARLALVKKLAVVLTDEDIPKRAGGPQQYTAPIR